MPPTAHITDPCVDEARERMGFKKKCICQFTMEFDKLVVMFSKMFAIVFSLFMVLTYGLKIGYDVVEAEL